MILTPSKRSIPLRRIKFAAATSEAPPHTADVATRWTALPGGVIDGGEIVLLAIKPSMWRPLFEAVPWMVVCCVLAGVLTGLRAPLPGLSLTATAEVILLVAFTRLGLAVIRWVPTWYLLTNRRIITIQGVRSPRMVACRLVDVRNTYLQASFAERLVRLGAITSVTDDTKNVSLLWQSVAKPDDVHARIRRAIENAIDQHHSGL